MIDEINALLTGEKAFCDRLFVFGGKKSKSKKIVMRERSTGKQFFLKVARSISANRQIESEAGAIKRVRHVIGDMRSVAVPQLILEGKVAGRRVNGYEYISHTDVLSLLSKRYASQILLRAMDAKRELDERLWDRHDARNFFVQEFEHKYNWFLRSEYAGGINIKTLRGIGPYMKSLKTGFYHGDFIPSNILYDAKVKRLVLTDFEYSSFDGLPLLDFYWLIAHVAVQSRNVRMVWSLCERYHEVKKRYIHDYDMDDISAIELAATCWFIWEILQREGEEISNTLKVLLCKCLCSHQPLITFLQNRLI